MQRCSSDWHNLIYMDHLLISLLLTCGHFPQTPMYKLCRNLVFWVAHFQMFRYWLILCKSMFTPDLCDWMAYRAPLIPWFWIFSWLCASNVCIPFRRSYAFYAKIHIFLHTSITEDNAYMWLPLAFQVQYLDFYICFIAYRVI